jgi:hypothetical protein
LPQDIDAKSDVIEARLSRHQTFAVLERSALVESVLAVVAVTDREPVGRRHSVGRLFRDLAASVFEHCPTREFAVGGCGRESTKTPSMVTAARTKKTLANSFLQVWSQVLGKRGFVCRRLSAKEMLRRPAERTYRRRSTDLS